MTARPFTRRQRRLVTVGLLLAVTMLAEHAALTRLQYQVGQFNDDGLYVSLARALVHGQGFHDLTVVGHPLETFVPPGFPALLAPSAAVGGFTSYRVEVFCCMALVLPLTFWWVRRWHGSPALASAAVAVLVVSPLVSDYSTYVMAEGPYLAVLMAALIVLHQWERSPRTLPPSGVGCLVLLLVLVYLKSAGIAVLLGVLAWWALRRSWARLAVSLTVLVAGLAPVVISRISAGVSPLGSDYGSQLSTYYQGGIVSRLEHSVPTGLQHFFTSAIPDTMFGTGSTFLQRPGWSVVGELATYSTVPLILLGFAGWQLRRATRDATLVIVPFYLCESLAYLNVNDRRAILLAPLLAVWWAAGVGELARAVTSVIARVGPLGAARLVGAATATALAIVAGTAAVSHAGTDYRGRSGLSLSPRAGWVTLLRQDPGPLASYYLYSTYALTDRPQAPSAFSFCVPAELGAAQSAAEVAEVDAQVLARLRADDARDVLLAPWGQTDGLDACMAGALATGAAIRTYDDASQGVSVWQLLPPGSRNALQGRTPRATPVQDTWSIAGCTASSVSVDGARGAGAGTVTVEVRDRRGRWHPVGELPGGIVPSGGDPEPTTVASSWRSRLSGGIVTGVRVRWSGAGPLTVSDVNLVCTDG